MAERYQSHWDDMVWAIVPNLVCSAQREYVTTPLIQWHCRYRNRYVAGNYVEAFFVEFVNTTPIDQYFALLISGDTSDPNRGTQITSSNGAATIKCRARTEDPEETREDVGSIYFPRETVMASTDGIYTGTLATNIPVFLDAAAYATYIDPNKTDTQRLMALRKAVNYSDIPVEPEGDAFQITNPWQHGTWTAAGVSPDTDIAYRNLRGKILWGSMALYDGGYDDGSLKIGIKFRGEFSVLEYSVDNINWTTVTALPWNFFFKVRTNELGTFNYGLALGNGTIPKFKDEETADGFIDGTVPITEADNWDEISPNYPDPTVPGDPDNVTEFGEVGARSIFSQQYVVPLAVMYEIANTFYDTTTAGLWDDIKKGLQMYGDSPIEAIENLSYYPCDLTAIFPGTSQSHIYFGGYQMNLTQGDVYKIANPDGSKDLGSVVFNRIYNNWMDFEPYCKLFVNIPYCGEYQLDLSEYYGKTLAVKYFIDTRTGSCCCVLTADGHLVDKFNGQMGVQMPIKLTDFSAYANAQIQTLLGMGGQAAQNSGNIAQAANAGISGGAAGAAIAGAGALAVGMGGAIGAKTVYGLAQNNINRFNKTKGGSTSMLNMYMPQTICFTFEMNKPDVPKNFYQMNGYPSNVGGRIGSFTGYLKCDTVKLNMPGATDLEYEKARGLLLSGVYL